MGAFKSALDIKSPDGTRFERRGAYAMYVYKVSGMNSDKLRETFTLHLVSKEFMVNETVRCKKKFHRTTIDTHVHMILQSVLKTTKENKTNDGRYKIKHHRFSGNGVHKFFMHHTR